MKWILRLIGFVIVLILVAVVSVFLLPADRIARIASEQLAAATGRDVTISGDVSMTLWPILGVSLERLEVGNPDWAQEATMLTAEDAAIGVDLMAYWQQGTIRITHIEANRPVIRLESRDDGRASWVFNAENASTPDAAQSASGTNASTPAPFWVQKLQVADATLIYDAQGAERVSFSGFDLDVAWPERLGSATIDSTIAPAGQPVTIAAEIDGFAGFLAGQVQLINAQLSTRSDSAALDGRANTAGEVAGQLRLDIGDTDAFMTALGLPAPGLPPKLGQSLDVTAGLTLTADQRLALRDVTADLGGNSLTGAADVTLADKPVVNAQFNAGALDLRSLTGDTGQSGGGGQASSASAGTGWPTDRIDASGLSAFDGEIALTASSVDLGDFQLGPTRTLLRNDNSRMVFDLREVSAYGGTITGEFVMNNRSGLSVGGRIAASGLALQNLLSDAAGITRLSGTANGNLQFLGVGNTVDSIMKSLSGSGDINVGRGTIDGVDLDRLMRSGDVGGGTTVFDSLRASWGMDGGVLRNDDLLLSLPNYEARGSGDVGLGAQNIDYTFTPVALRANSGTGIAIPVRIRGPWASPTIRPDLEAAINLNAQQEIEEAKDRVDEVIREKVVEELGITDTGQDLEEAAKEVIEDKIQEELQRGLRSMFD